MVHHVGKDRQKKSVENKESGIVVDDKHLSYDLHESS
jgi:hypothetical protein